MIETKDIHDLPDEVLKTLAKVIRLFDDGTPYGNGGVDALRYFAEHYISEEDLTAIELSVKEDLS